MFFSILKTSKCPFYLHMFKSFQELLCVICFLSVFISCNGQSDPATFNENSKPQKEQAVLKKIRLVSELTQEEIKAFIKTNPCYLPLLKDSNYWENGMPLGFNDSALYNDVISKQNPFRNRYIVGDFNALNPDGSNRTVNEVYPQLDQLFDFKDLPKVWLDRIQQCKPNTPEFDTLLAEIKRSKLPNSIHYYNFLNKVFLISTNLLNLIIYADFSYHQTKFSEIIA